MAEFVIITRHKGLVEWLAARGITGTVISQATPADVRGKIVVGAIPNHLQVLAERVIGIDLPNLREDQRGKDLTPAEMDAAGATMSTYWVFKTLGPELDVSIDLNDDEIVSTKIHEGWLKDNFREKATTVDELLAVTKKLVFWCDD
jgi:putative CRISPR-associated protein (TIGR02620 family)